jgi:sulfate adenylyltransferase subunit 2
MLEKDLRYMNHLYELENESIYIFREIAAQFENPALLFSGGKDSIVLVHIAIKAFYPAKFPFTLLHIDTGQNFPEVIKFRDNLAGKTGSNIVIGYVQGSIDNGKALEETGYNASRNKLQSITLLETIEKYKFDVAIGGGRRDEEKSRAKERFFSHRDEFGQWNPKNQRPEIWNIYNGKKNVGEHFRIFPISNWTELDIWQYILMENIELPEIYFSHKREVFCRDGVWLAYAPFMKLKPDEKIETKTVRCRTVGDIACTGLSLSKASTLEEIVKETATTRITERGSRWDDKRSESSMEDRKIEGYF